MTDTYQSALDVVQEVAKVRGFDWTGPKEQLLNARPQTIKRLLEAAKRGAARRGNEEVAAIFGYKGAADLGGRSRTMPVYARIEKPLDLRALPAKNVSAKRLVEALQAAGLEVTMRDFPYAQRDLYQMLNQDSTRELLQPLAEKAGYDGIIYKDYFDPTTRGESYIVFDSSQIKSSIGYRGTFDPADPDTGHGEKVSAEWRGE